MNTFNNRNDEDLLLSSRMGDLAAENELTQRFFHCRFSSCKLASPEACVQLDDWELNDAHFHAFLNAMTSFRFQGVRFFTYYIDVLRHELIYLASRKSRERSQLLYIDMDAPMQDEKGNEFTLADSFPSGQPMDDPQAFFQYADTLRRINKLPRGISPGTLDLVGFVAKGYDLKTAASYCGFTRDKAKYEIGKYRRWALKTIREVYREGEDSIEEKEKLLDAFLNGDEEE